MDNEELTAEIQKKPAIWDPKDALHFSVSYTLFFVYSTLFKYFLTLSASASFV